MIALDTVQALVVRTGDFAAFISAHPAVLGIVESQFYDRSREDPVRYRPDEVLAGFRSSYPHLLDGENCTVLLSDVVGFGARTRTDEDRRVIREALFRITHVVLQELPHEWSWDDRGDGLLTVVPPSVPTARIIQHLHKELPTALEEHNRAHSDSARIQLRVAVNVGPVVTDTMGVSGEAIIIAARLVEAPLFKEEMDRARAALGVIAFPRSSPKALLSGHNPST